MSKNNIIWLTGLSCSGKTTLAKELMHHIPDSIHLEGEMIRKHILPGLGYDIVGRTQVMKYLFCFAKILRDNGKTVVVCSVTNPESLFKKDFFLIWVYASLRCCMYRDYLLDKGVYNDGMVIGKDIQYIAPSCFDVMVETDKMDVDDCVKQILRFYNG